jgi:hypothetical protein
MVMSRQTKRGLEDINVKTTYGMADIIKQNPELKILAAHPFNDSGICQLSCQECPRKYMGQNTNMYNEDM